MKTKLLLFLFLVIINITVSKAQTPPNGFFDNTSTTWSVTGNVSINVESSMNLIYLLNTSSIDESFTLRSSNFTLFISTMFVCRSNFYIINLIN